MKSKLTFSLSPVTLGLAAITAASFISLLTASTNKIEALLMPFGPVTFGALTIFSLLFILDKAKHRILITLYVATTIIGLIAIYQFFGMGKWVPTGSVISTVTLLVLVLPLLIGETLKTIKSKRESLIAFYCMMTLIVISGLGITLWQLVPHISESILPLKVGLNITLDVLKNPQTAVAGVGAENFLSAFTKNRSADINLTPIWLVRFTTNANLLFHLAATYGLLGASASLLFLKSFFGRKINKSLQISLGIGFISTLITPPSLTILIVLVLLLSQENNHHNILHLTNRFGRFIFLLISGVLCIGATYFIARAYASEFIFSQSLQSAQQNDGTSAYNLQIKAIKFNPYIARYHMIFSQTNMALAASTKDQKMIPQLIQQAIGEAKRAVELAPSNVIMWENLARTYQQLIGVAQNADNWTIASYQQALILDPTNPMLFVDFGLVFVQLKKYPDAITQFKRSIALKPDYANAYYNLGNAYKLSGDINAAIAATKQAKAVVGTNAVDASIISQQLEDLQKMQK